MSSVIITQLSSEGLNDEQKEMRDEYLEYLHDHLNDVSSYVRSKVLQIWNELEQRNAVPLAWKLKVVIRAVERLEDKTASVRKNAITLLKTVLEANPFASKVKVFYAINFDIF